MDISSIPGITVELVAAASVIIVVKIFLSHMKELRQETKETFKEIQSVIDRNTTALALNSETMNRVIDIVTHCKIKENKKER